MSAEFTPAKKFLHVGCGSKRKDQTVKPFAGDDWHEVTLDIDARAGPDIVDCLPELAEVPAGSFDAVYSAHNIEHLYPHEVPTALAAFRRVLNDGGIAIITCPDLQTIGEQLSSGDIDAPLYVSPAGPISALDILFGHRQSLAGGNLYMAHHCGFTLKSLMAACTDAAFGGVAGLRRPRFRDLWVLATKAPTSETELRRLSVAFLVPA